MKPKFNWTTEQDNYIKDNFGKITFTEMATNIGCSLSTVRRRAEYLGFELKKSTSEKWTEEEVEILKQYANKCHYTELTKVLPNRTAGAISAKAFELGITIISNHTKLDEDSILYIKNNWGKITISKMARNLKTTTSVINRYRKELGLPKLVQKRKWTKQLINKLKKDARYKTKEELANKYKTSVRQVLIIARKNNIKLVDSKNFWNTELDKELLDLVRENQSIKNISLKMKIGEKFIEDRIKKIRKKTNYNKWTKDEVKLLVKLSLDKNSLEIANLMSKTEKQIIDKARRLGINLIKSKSNVWTNDETLLLLRLKDAYEVHMIAKVMGRADSTIIKKAKELNISLKYKQQQYWTKEEESLLEDYAKEHTAREIAYLMDRSISSISSKLRRIGLSPKLNSKIWTDSECKQLISLSKELTIEEIAIKMNKSYASISCKLYSLGITAKNLSNRKWTEEEEKLLLELLSMYSSFEVSELLERSEEAIITRAIQLGYIIDSKHRRWTEEEEILLQDLWGNTSIEKISSKLNRTQLAIINKISRLNIGSQIANNYLGITVVDLANLFLLNPNTILTSWVALGLQIKYKKRSNNSIYSYVEIEKLYDFLEKNQNIWDSRVLEKNILGIEPEWLKEKRKKDKLLPIDCFKIQTLAKQKLLQAKKYFLEIENDTVFYEKNSDYNENNDIKVKRKTL